MSACITLLTGPAQSGKTESLLAHYRDVLASRPLEAVLWLAPTWRAAAEVRGRLLTTDLAGCFRPGIMTFEKYADSVLHAAAIPIRPMTRLMKRELVRQLIDAQLAQGRVRHFKSIARTSGLVDLVCEFISELKRLEIWPEEFQRACAARGLADKDTELLEIYDGYQQALRERELYDAEGRFWSARDILRKGAPGTWPSPLVVVDGFTDFTRTQHEILQILARDAERTFISLTLEPEPRRTDLFDKPLRTLAELRRRHAGLVVQELPRAPMAAWPAMRHLEQSLFTNPRARPPVELAANEMRDIEVLAAARPEGEVELIGARIKHLLADGVARPGDIAIVFRSPGAADLLVGEVFGRMGIPTILESGEPLERSPAMRALVRLLQFDLDDWPFSELLAVLRCNYFLPAWADWHSDGIAAAAEQTVRRLQLPHGRDRLLAEIRSLAAHSGNGGVADEPHHAAAAREASAKAATALTLFEGLARAFDALPAKATLAEWAKAWAHLTSQTGLLHAANARNDNAEASASTLADRAAWNRLMESLAAGDQLAEWLGQAAPVLDRREAFEALLDILQTEQIGHAGDESGYVRVLSAASVRSLQIPYLFLAGLSEKAFPPPDREDRLYSEADYVRLIEAGLPLVARSERNREEMLLFYEALTRATKRLYLSYPALDASAQPLSPSPYLTEVEQACGGRLARTELADLSPVPRDEDPLSARDFRVRAVATALEGNVALLAGFVRAASGESLASPSQERPVLARSCVENVLAGLEMNHRRQERERFGPAEGMLQGKAARHYLSARYPQQRTFSATELEQYATCPFRFFLERVLNVKPLEDLTLEIDAMQRGLLAHDVMAIFHRRVNERLGRPGSPMELDAEEFDHLLAAALDEASPPAPSNPVEVALREIDRRQVRQWLGTYRAQCGKYDQQWTDCESPFVPEVFEISFGRGDAPPLSTDRPLEICAGQQVIRLSGRIDRVDTGVVAGHTVFNVLDYKTGGSIRLTPETIARGLTLQLPLYTIAVMDLILTDRDAVPWQAAYWYLRDDGVKPRQALRMYSKEDGRIELDPKWEQIREGLADTVAGLVRGIQRGRFQVCNIDERCTGYCPLSTVCRVNQVRALEKTCLPTMEVQ